MSRKRLLATLAIATVLATSGGSIAYATDDSSAASLTEAPASASTQDTGAATDATTDASTAADTSTADTSNGDTSTEGTGASSSDDSGAADGSDTSGDDTSTSGGDAPSSSVVAPAPQSNTESGTDTGSGDANVSQRQATQEQIDVTGTSCDQQQSPNGNITDVSFTGVTPGNRYQLDSSTGLFEFDQFGGGRNLLITTDADTFTFYGSGIPATTPTVSVTLRNTTAGRDSNTVTFANPCFVDTVPVETVTLTTTTPVVDFGQPVHLDWLSSNATNLTAGGDPTNVWSGVKSNNGNEDFVPTAPGVYNYTLTSANGVTSTATVTVNELPVTECSTDINTAEFAVNYPSVTGKTTTEFPACEDITTFLDGYTLPGTYDGSGEFNASASPQQYIPGARGVLTIKKGETEATFAGSLLTACGQYVQVDIYRGPQQDIVTFPQGSNGFIVGGISETPLPDCGVVDNPGDGGNTPNPPAPNPVTPEQPVTMTPVVVPNAPVNTGVTSGTTAPTANNGYGPFVIAGGNTGDTPPASSSDKLLWSFGIIGGLGLLALGFAVTSRKRGLHSAK